MSKDRDKTVYCREDGQWANKMNDADRSKDTIAPGNNTCPPKDKEY